MCCQFVFNNRITSSIFFELDHIGQHRPIKGHLNISIKLHVRIEVYQNTKGVCINKALWKPFSKLISRVKHKGYIS